MDPEDLDDYLNSIGFRFRRLYLDIGKLILQRGFFFDCEFVETGALYIVMKEEKKKFIVV